MINKKNSATAPVPFGNEPCICLNKSRLKKELVFFKVLPAFHFLKAALENHKYPFPLPGQTGSIEYVAVLSSQGRKGFSKGGLDYITGLNLANLYSLEVGDTNIPTVEFFIKNRIQIVLQHSGQIFKEKRN